MIQLTVGHFVIFRKVKLTPMHRNLSTRSDLVSLLMAVMLPFCCISRFGYWAYDILYRKRLLTHWNFCIKQNPKHNLLSIEDVQETLESRTYKQAVSKLLHYAKNVSGPNNY